MTKGHFMNMNRRSFNLSHRLTGIFDNVTCDLSEMRSEAEQYKHLPRRKGERLKSLYALLKLKKGRGKRKRQKRIGLSKKVPQRYLYCSFEQ